MIECLEKEDITFINQRTVSEHGGNFMPPQTFYTKKTWIIFSKPCKQRCLAHHCIQP